MSEGDQLSDGSGLGAGSTGPEATPHADGGPDKARIADPDTIRINDPDTIRINDPDTIRINDVDTVRLESAELLDVDDTVRADTVDLSRAVAALTDSGLDRGTRSKLLGRVMRHEIRERGVKDLFRPRSAARWVADAVADVTPYIPVRDLETLRAHHDGLDGEELVERLVRNAARVTAGIGAASGGVAAVEWAAAPALLSAPVLLAAETVAVVAVEIKLIAELHEVYRQPLPGNGTQRAVALVQSWANRRGVNPFTPGRGVAAALSTAARKELRERLVRRLGRNLTTLGPLLTGAAVAGYLNQRATRSLGADIRTDLRKRGPAIGPGR
ncbi:hypothetical protein ACNTMW_08165 [Planosporangium sp. 12N6]|uniref:hypothetical protein n=1 Tax=Planosporangium spinosum TaxID=3402278 RepID=UPI003CF8DCCD